MLPVRKVVFVLLAALLVGGGFMGYRYAVRVPRPALVYPSGQRLESVRGNCGEGSELFGCKAAGGPRSFLTVHAPGEPRVGSQKMFDGLLAHGWTQDSAGETAHDFGADGAPEDLQPVYCRKGGGCVGLFRYVEQGYVLAWFS